MKEIKFYTIECPMCRVLEKKMITKGVKYTKIMDTKVFEELELDLFPVLEVDGRMLYFREAIDYINNI